LPPDLADDLKQLKSVINLNQSGTFVFPPDIEEEANSLFGKVLSFDLCLYYLLTHIVFQIYTGKLTIEDAISLLKSFKVSKNPRLQLLFVWFDYTILNLIQSESKRSLLA